MNFSELWYDSIKTSAQMELMCLEEPSLVAYNYGEDLQVLREQLADAEARLAIYREVSQFAQDKWVAFHNPEPLQGEGHE